jgi:hypothetical protein
LNDVHQKLSDREARKERREKRFLPGALRALCGSCSSLAEIYPSVTRRNFFIEVFSLS